MTQNAQPPVSGQVDAPNPIELFWEKNRKTILIVVGIVVLALAGHSFKKKLDRDARNADWSQFSTATAFDKAYAETPEGWTEAQDMASQNAQFSEFYIGSALRSARQSLVSDLGTDLQSADRGALAELAKGSDGRAPLSLWLLAGLERENEEWDAALGHLSELEKRFQDHLLCTQSAHPAQFQPTVPEEDDEDEEDKPSKTEEPEYEPAVSGSPVAMMRQAIEAARSFRADHPEFYEAPEPTSAKTIVFEIEGAGKVAFKLYDQAAPLHAAKLLQLAEEGWWKGMAVHQLLRRESGVGPFGNRQSAQGEFSLGWAATKDETNRDNWKAGDVDEEHEVEWEDSGVSHFPGMVAVEAGTEDKSQVERLIFNSVDMASQMDGSRVVVGRVVEGLDVIDQIVNSSFLVAADEEQGRGAPFAEFRITDVRVE